MHTEISNMASALLEKRDEFAGKKQELEVCRKELANIREQAELLKANNEVGEWMNGGWVSGGGRWTGGWTGG